MIVKNIKNLVIFDLKKDKKTIIIWAIAIFLITSLYMTLYSSVKEITATKLETMPKELLQAFGFNNLKNTNTFNGYFAMIFKIIIIPITFFALSFSFKIISEEESSKSIENLYSLPILRKEIFISKAITSFLSLSFITLLSFISLILSTLIVKEDINYTLLTKTFFITTITPYIFHSLALCLSAIDTKISLSSASLIVIISYVLGYLSSLLKDTLGFLKYFSPFELFNPLNEVSNYSIVIYLVLMVIFYILGLYFYNKRDFNL